MTTQEIMDAVRRLGVTLKARSGRIRATPRGLLPPEVIEAIREHKVELLGILTKQAVEPPEPEHEVEQHVEDHERHVEPVIAWEELPDPGEPCPVCGSLMKWRSMTDVEHCLRCDPLVKSIELWHRAERIRRRLRMPSDPEAAEHMQLLQRLAQSRNEVCKMPSAEKPNAREAG